MVKFLEILYGAVLAICVSTFLPFIYTSAAADSLTINTNDKIKAKVHIAAKSFGLEDVRLSRLKAESRSLWRLGTKHHRRA